MATSDVGWGEDGSDIPAGHSVGLEVTELLACPCLPRFLRVSHCQKRSVPRCTWTASPFGGLQLTKGVRLARMSTGVRALVTAAEGSDSVTDNGDVGPDGISDGIELVFEE